MSDCSLELSQIFVLYFYSCLPEQCSIYGENHLWAKWVPTGCMSKMGPYKAIAVWFLSFLLKNKIKNIYIFMFYFKNKIKKKLFFTRVWNSKADAVWGKGSSSPPAGQNLGMAGWGSVPPDWSPAFEGHSLALEDCAMQRPEVSALFCVVHWKAGLYAVCFCCCFLPFFIFF